ncbi:hypothetical protein [Nocardia sp. NPDC057440]|uniref:hypothetical protein n=1 Tax=Nocardia sp. NPDC057440 TaxID=3346134 RepID=UPI00366F7E5B
MSIKRTSLDWARDIARSYRSALHAVDPERCAQLDEVARKRGQQWIAPSQIPAHLVDEALDAVLSPLDIAHLWSIPVGTIYGWVSKGLLKPMEGKGRSAKYRVRDVFDVSAKARASRVDSA